MASAKPILYFALASPRMGVAGTFRVIAVTSEKARQVYGRDMSAGGGATHTSVADILHRFPADTAESYALAAADRAAVVRQAWAPTLRQAEKLVSSTRRTMNDAVLRAAMGGPPLHVPAPSESDVPVCISHEGSGLFTLRRRTWRNLWGLL